MIHFQYHNIRCDAIYRAIASSQSCSKHGTFFLDTAFDDVIHLIVDVFREN